MTTKTDTGSTMSDITVVEFEQRQAHLSSELDEGPPYTVHGIALGAGDITRGASGVKKKWPADELKNAAESLEGTNLVEDHENSARGVVGEVTKAGYKEGVGILYEAELFDDELAERISNGLLEVSVRGFHKDVDEMEETEDGAKIVEDIEFDNLSIVASGASPSNTIEMGPAEELSVAALSSHISSLQEDEESDEEEEDGSDEEAEIEPGMWVEWADGKGITISQPEDGEIEVDVYEESDGKWRSTGETTMVSTDSLTEWDVDEDEDIGAREEEDDSEEEESDEEEEETEDDEAETAKHHHEATMEMVDEFMGMDDNDEETFISAFLEWADDDDARQAVDEFVDASDENSLESPISDLVAWLDEKVDESEQETHPDEEDEETDEMDPDVEDDEESEAEEDSDEEEDESTTEDNHHETSLGLISQFASSETNTINDSVQTFIEWADDDSVRKSVNEFVSKTENDLSAPVETYRSWLQAALGQEEMEEVEGESEVFGSDHERAKNAGDERNPDGHFDDEYTEEASADDGESASESSDVEELQEYEFHEVSWDGTTESDWSSPDMEDFDTDDLGEVADHFIISATGFPPENFSDLKLPVVEPNGDLNVNALSAVKGGRGVSAVEGLSDDMEERIVEYVNGLANEHFDKDWGMEENAVTSPESPTDPAEPAHDPDEESEQADPVSASLDLINIFLRQNGKDERDSVDKMLGWLFSSTDVPNEKMAQFRVAANAFLDQQGGADSFDAVDVESFRDWLLTQGGQTADGKTARDESPRIATPVHVLTGDDLTTVNAVLRASKTDDYNEEHNMTDIEEELAELDEPVAVEKDDFESLQEKADRMEELSDNLEALRERTEVLDSVDREQVEELADSDDPVVLDSDEYEELTAEAEQVKAVYAEALSDESPFSADELTDKFSIEELREKYEEAGHDLEEELEAEPRSGDVDEEELEEQAEEENQSEEELQQAEEIESEQERLREMITSN